MVPWGHHAGLSPCPSPPPTPRATGPGIFRPPSARPAGTATGGPAGAARPGAPHRPGRHSPLGKGSVPIAPARVCSPGRPRVCAKVASPQHTRGNRGTGPRAGKQEEGRLGAKALLASRPAGGPRCPLGTLAPQRLQSKAQAASQGPAHTMLLCPCGLCPAQPPSCPESQAAGPGQSLSMGPARGGPPQACRQVLGGLHPSASPAGDSEADWTWHQGESVGATTRRHPLSPWASGLPVVTWAAQGPPARRSQGPYPRPPPDTPPGPRPMPACCPPTGHRAQQTCPTVPGHRSLAEAAAQPALRWPERHGPSRRSPDCASGTGVRNRPPGAMVARAERLESQSHTGCTGQHGQQGPPPPRVPPSPRPPASAPGGPVGLRQARAGVSHRNGAALWPPRPASSSRVFRSSDHPPDQY